MYSKYQSYEKNNNGKLEHALQGRNTPPVTRDRAVLACDSSRGPACCCWNSGILKYKKFSV